MVDLLLLELFECAGTLAFAFSGAIVGARRGMDLFGVLVLALVTATAGGVARDLLIGAIPPAAIRNWHAAALATGAGAIAFRFRATIERLRFSVLLFDAAGLGIFAATGAQKALQFGISPIMAAVLGMITGIGGGMIRDVLTARMPVVLHADIYAVAAFAAAATAAASSSSGAPAAASLLAGSALCFFLRLMAIYQGWSLPRPSPLDRTSPD